MKTKFVFYLAFLCLIFISSCKDDDDNQNVPDPCNNLVKDEKENGVDCGEDNNCVACHDIIIEKELLIRHLAVVDSEEAKTGSLSFSGLMKKMVPEPETKDLIVNLVNSWSNPQQVNGITIDPRPAVTENIFSLWRNNQGLPPNADVSELDIEFAPFRLLAVTNRIDLKNLDDGSAGEGRLTFGLTNNGQNDFTLIFEFNLLAEDQSDIIQWAKQWHSLSAIEDSTSTEYLDTLINIVETFSSVPNGLNQLRTNEVIGGLANGSFLWEFREFNFNGTGFQEVSRKQSPGTEHQNSQLLADYITAHSGEILADNHTILEEFDNQKFLAGNALYDGGFKWTLPGQATGAELDKLNAISCTGCHGGLVDGTRFTHIKPRQEGTPASISPFLSVDLVIRRDSIGRLLEQDLIPVAPPQTFIPSSDAMAKIIPLSEEAIEEIRALIAGIGGAGRGH